MNLVNDSIKPIDLLPKSSTDAETEIEEINEE